MQFKSYYLNPLLLLLLYLFSTILSAEISQEELSKLETAAINGDVNAQSQIASMYYLGEGVEQNHKQAFAWYLLAAEQGDANAQYSLGNLYLLGEGIQPNQEEAIFWYQKSAGQGHQAAISRLQSISQETSESVTADDSNQYAGAPVEQTADTDIVVADNQSPENSTSKKSDLFDQLFGDEEQQNEVIVEDESIPLEKPTPTTISSDNSKKPRANLDLQPGPIVNEKALEETVLYEPITQDNPELYGLYQKAREGDADAQYIIGKAFYQGRGVTQNYDQAFLWFRRSAENGHADAQFQLGNIYLMGEGVLQDDYEALYWYELAAKQNHREAQQNLDSLKQYTESKNQYAGSVEKTETLDVIESVESITPKTANETSDAQMQYQQGIKYSIGDGVERDYEKAFQLFKQSAEAGHVPAQYQLGIAYAFGEGIGKDITESFKWMEKSARGGDLLAQRQLASMYLSGNGTEKNRVNATAWYMVVAEQGNEMDLQRLVKIKSEMSEQEVIEAEQIASGLMSSISPTR